MRDTIFLIFAFLCVERQRLYAAAAAAAAAADDDDAFFDDDDVMTTTNRKSASQSKAESVSHLGNCKSVTFFRPRMYS